MKLKNNWKRFWTLDRHHAAGFTLVELIVVIAILAILAGVAIPVYSGYIKKAETAGDQQLLDTINTAFAAACMENNVDRYSLSAVDAQIKLTANKTVDMTSIKPVAVQESFSTYFAGNTTTQFKTVSEIIYVRALGMFATTDQSGNVNISYAGATLSVPQEYIDLVSESTFITATTLGGTDGLLDKIAGVTDFASNIIGTGGNAANLLTGVTTSPEFRAFAAEALGIDPSDNAAFIAKNTELLAEMRKNPLYADKSDTELSNIYLTNASVLFAAQNATQMSQEDIMASLTNPDVKNSIITEMQKGNTTNAFSQATLAYGMYTAWAHAEGKTTEQGYGEIAVMNDLNNPEFQAWLKTDQADADLEAYLAALTIVNSNTQDPDAVSNLVVNGFDDSELKNAIGELFK